MTGLPGGAKDTDSGPAASRRAAYSVGFLLLWAFAAASSALTCCFQRGAAEINR